MTNRIQQYECIWSLRQRGTEVLSSALCAKMPFAYNQGVGYRLGVSQKCMNSFFFRCQDVNYASLLCNALYAPGGGNVPVGVPALPLGRKVCLITGWLVFDELYDGFTSLNSQSFVGEVAAYQVGRHVSDVGQMPCLRKELYYEKENKTWMFNSPRISPLTSLTCVLTFSLSCKTQTGRRVWVSVPHKMWILDSIWERKSSKWFCAPYFSTQSFSLLSYYV